MNRSNWRISFLCILFLVCLGLTFVAAPVFEKVEAASAVNIGAADALAALEDQVKALPNSAFSNPHQRKTLLNKIDAVINQIESGAYNRAINKLQTDIKDKVSKWIVASEQADLIGGIDVAIEAINNASQTTVTTLYGKVAGADAGNDSWVWKGVPYAKPPVGSLRWRAPKDLQRWHGIRHSTDSCDVCTQAEMTLLWTPTNHVIGSEDCLYLNIFRPKTDAKNLPVYVWIHGGANVFGGVTNYDGSVLASNSNMVVVFIQYRLGPFGWFTHPVLNPKGTSEDKSGNYGTLDTIKAVEWVRKNISTFGGDPNNIMVGGQSAGGFNTQNLLISPLAKGLFHRAFIQSAGGGVVPVSTGIDLANAIIDKLLAADGKTRAGMSDAQIAAYLRRKAASEIEQAVMVNGSIPLGSISPFTDGAVIPGTFADMISVGQYSKMPIILGSTKYELKPFLPLFYWTDVFGILTGAKTFQEVFPTVGSQIAYEYSGLYPSRNWKAVMVDSLARLLKQNQDNVYCYLFKWGGKNIGPGLDFLYGAGHAMDIPFFFGWDHDVYGLTLLNASNQQGRVALQQAMMSYLEQFAVTGNPNATGSGLTAWQEWSNETGGPKSIIFDGSNTEALISMGNEELTKAGVDAEIEALPEPLRSLVKAFVLF